MKRLCIGLVLFTLAGCANVRTSTSRFAKDLTVVAMCPVQIPCAGVEDALAFSDDDSVSVSFSPAVAPLMMVKHAFFTAIYAVDAVWYPIYLPLGLEPMDLYELDRFPWDTNAEGHQWIYEELFGGVENGP